MPPVPSQIASMFVRPMVLVLAVAVASVFSLAQYSPLNQRMQFPAHDLPEISSLSGNVRGSDNQPLKNVRIELREVGSGTTRSSVYTNTAGYFEFPGIASGRYEIVASAGMEETRERIDFNGFAGSVNLRLSVTARPPDERGRNSVSVAQYKIPAKAQEEFKKARQAAREQKTEETQQHLEKALALYPAYAEALTLRGILKFTHDDAQGAMADFQEAIQSDANYGPAYIALGAAQNMQSKFDDAIRSLERGQALSPSAWQAYFEMGRALMAKGSYEQALAQFDRAQALVPGYSLLHLVRAQAMLALSNYSGAVTELQVYLAKDPNGSESQTAREMLDKAQAYAAVKQPQ